MNPHQVKEWANVEKWLESKGFVKTPDRINGGQVWRSKSRRHIIVPDAVDGFYPEYFWNDLVERVDAIVP